NPDLPDEFEHILNKALEKDKTLRYQHASDLKADLLRLERDATTTPVSVAAGPATTAQPGLWLGLAGAAITITAALIFLGRGDRASEPGIGSTASIGSITEPEIAAQSGPAAKSIAVLSFVNMSSDEEQEYFSDGLSEELLNLLAKIPDLQVTSRSSAFSFKGQNLGIPEIARRLNVAHILEGSVRKAGNQIRITAQLIDTNSDTHLWSETYDRSLDNIFAVQDEIASEVVTQLKVTLLDDAPTVREIDPEAYALFLQGRHLRRQHTPEAYEQALALLQQAVEIDPGFADAWVNLATVYMNQSGTRQRPVDEAFTLARKAINKALAADPEFAPAHAHLGAIAMAYDNDLVAAARHRERALQLEPTNTSIIGGAVRLTASLGRLNEAIPLAEYVVTRDPVSFSARFGLGSLYSAAGRWDEAIATFSTLETLSPGSTDAQYGIGVALLFKGEPQAALEAFQLETTSFGMAGLSMAYHALGRASESDAALAELIEQHEQEAAYNIAYVLAYRGEADRAFEWLDKAVQYKDWGLVDILGERLFDNLHDDPRWLPFLERIGSSPEQLAAIEFKVTLPRD
ncbi:MAG: tetratricopeptide repeat protein, partial [Acidobacteriota bacterium]|nr:tetratricopeptide repeat protein [Acidobacteriota bacterium]